MKFIVTAMSSLTMRAVLLIALLAISRKFVILDLSVTTPATIAALASVTLVIGFVYWLLARKDVAGN